MLLLRHRWALAALSLLVAGVAGCGDSSDGSEPKPAGTGQDMGLCPVPGPLPFQTTSKTFESSDAKDWKADNPYVTHWGLDFLGTASPQQLSGAMTRATGPNLLAQKGIVDEWVSFWSGDLTGAWLELGRVKTDALGGFAVTLSGDQQFPVGTSTVYSILEGDGTCAAHGVFVWPAATQVIVTDIDGTLTLDDNEMLTQIMQDPDYVPKANQGASEMVNAWAGKGYQLAYLSARPHSLSGISRKWLQGIDAPFGPVQTSESLVNGESARAYKAEFLKHITTDLGWEIVAVYGNADSDIQAYEDAGIPKDVTFIIGELAGDSGTVAIANNDYTSHISSYVDQQPDAQKTF